MNEIHKAVQGLAEPGDGGDSSDLRGRPQSLRDRWESVRYGPVGRVLRYCLTFALVFALIFLFLWALEHLRF